MEGIRWKFVSAISILAMAVSMLSGGLSGIAFGMLVVRALIGGAVFAVLAVGLNLFITRFFPELFEEGTEYDDGPETFESGRNVDIVVPAESPEAPVGTPLDSDDRPLAGEAIENIPGDSAVEPGPEAAPADDHEAGTVGDLDRFSEDFMEVEGEPTNGSGPAAADVPGGDREPQELAQAIQTVMKRDEKG